MLSKWSGVLVGCGLASFPFRLVTKCFLKKHMLSVASSLSGRSVCWCYRRRSWFPQTVAFRWLSPKSQWVRGSPSPSPWRTPCPLIEESENTVGFHHSINIEKLSFYWIICSLSFEQPGKQMTNHVIFCVCQGIKANVRILLCKSSLVLNLGLAQGESGLN